MNPTIETTVNKQVLLYAVQRHIFCQITGKILDIRDAVLLIGTRGEETICNLVMLGEVWDSGKDAIAANWPDAEFEVIDGREL